MRKSCRIRLFPLLMALIPLLSSLAPAVLAAEEAKEAEEIIPIASVDDLRALAQSCALDTYSLGKTVVLKADLNLEGIEFTPIPTFGGLFSGEGHTISGLRITAAGSSLGLFRYLQPTGRIQNLTVEGTVSPAGTRSAVGGIVGDNAGQIEGCAFIGSVRGESSVGGIAGRNRLGGQIVRCTVSGDLSGENATGGIVGRNLGQILFCENHAGVNLTEGESSVDLRAADAGAVLEERATADEETYHLLASASDTGGIAGYSCGEIQNSTNFGGVGYPHVGYNTGGVVGRSSGYVSQCANFGAILGRKDVGGIVGQAEPYVLIDPGRDFIEELRRELNTLEGLINRALDSASRTGDSVSAQLSLMGDTAGDAKDSSKAMLDRLSDFADGTVDSANTLLSDITDALNRLSPALDDLAEAGRRLERLSRQLGAALDDLKDASAIGADILRELRDAVSGLQRAGNRLTRSADSLSAAAESFVLSTVSYDAPAADQAAGEIETALEDLGGAFSDAAGTASDLRGALSGAEDLPQSDELLPALKDAEQALGDIAGAVEDLPAPPEITLPDIEDGRLDQFFEKLTQAGENLENALSAIQRALSHTDRFSGKLKDALESLKSASSTSAAIGRLIHSAFDAAGDAVDRLTGNGPVQFAPLGEEFRTASDGLYTAMGTLFEEMEGLNSLLSEGNHTLTADLRAVNRQCNVVFDLFLTAIDDLAEDAEQGIDAVLSDTSEEDIAATRAGKVIGSRNNGAVEGDRNVGGVAGAVAIELEVDPEDDTADRFSFGSTYETKAVLQDCVNTAAVTAKKDCAGGIAGRMDLGTAIGCQGYGPVESTGGNYTGGVVGYGDAAVRECCAKCPLSGKDYVGGIAGWASRMRDCRAIVTIGQGTEYLGAIVGGVEEEGVLQDNFFVDTGLAGVDGVSYAGRAEPIPFADLEALPDVPSAFLSFSLTLLAEGETVLHIPLHYGENTPPTLPPVPEVPGCYGVWPEIDTSDVRSDLTVEAVYTPWITVVASSECSGKLSLALAEGQFTQEALLRVSDSTQSPPDGGEDCLVWDVSLTGTDLPGGAAVPLRLLNPTGRAVALYQYRDGAWQAVEAEENGQYLLLTMEGTSGTFCLQPKSLGPWPLLLSGLAGVGLIAAVTAAVRRRKKNRTKADAKKEATVPSA